MSTEVRVQLVDLQRHRAEILPALRAFRERGDRGPLLRLLERARPLAPDLRSEVPQADCDREAARLRREASEAEARGNRWATREVVDRLCEYVNPRGPIIMKRADIDEATVSLQDPASQGERLTRMVERKIAPGLVELLCVFAIEGPFPDLEVERSVLGEYLGELSPSLRVRDGNLLSLFDAHGPALEVPLGEATQSFTRDDLDRLDAELEKVPRPPGSGLLQRDYDNLRAMVRRARGDPDLALVLTVR